jgi:hypothetical protein
MALNTKLVSASCPANMPDLLLLTSSVSPSAAVSLHIFAKIGYERWMLTLGDIEAFFWTLDSLLFVRCAPFRFISGEKVKRVCPSGAKNMSKKCSLWSKNWFYRGKGKSFLEGDQIVERGGNSATVLRGIFSLDVLPIYVGETYIPRFQVSTLQGTGILVYGDCWLRVRRFCLIKFLAMNILKT